MTEFPIELEQLGKTVVNQNLLPKRFVITNLEDDQLEDFILDNGDKVYNKLGESISCVISGNVMLVTGNMVEVYELGIHICTVSEFSRDYGYKCNSA